MDYITRTALRSSLPRSTSLSSTSRCLFSSSSRSLAADSPTTPAAAAPAEATPSPEATVAANEDNETVYDAESGRGGKGYRAWLSGEGAKFRRAIPGKTNWLGEQPFPLNPTFSPLPPLADATKSKIHNAYLYNITSSPSATDAQVVRAVSAKFGVAMDRVRAIIRLKELEKAWKEQGIPLQTNLLHGMESHLGVKQPGEKWRGAEEADPVQPVLSQGKTVFEMVDVEAGDAPVFLPLLSHLPSTPSSPSTSPAPSAPSPKSTLIKASRPGRASTLFRDVSGTKEGEKLGESYDAKRTRRGKKAVGKVTVKGE